MPGTRAGDRKNGNPLLRTTPGISDYIADMSKTDDTYDVNESFPMLIANCEKYMRESLNKRFRDAGFNVTTEQWIILVHLGQQDGISQQELADRYNRSKVSALHLIRKLKKEGFVVRRPNPLDGRSKRIYLTPMGRKLLHTLIPLAKTNIAYMSKGISTEEIETLKTTVRKITNNLKK